MAYFILVLRGGGGRSWGFVGKSIREARAIISQEKKNLLENKKSHFKALFVLFQAYQRLVD